MTNTIATKAGASVPAMIDLIEKRGEARADSRLIAKSLGNQHKNTRELIEKYAPELEQFGKVPFETEALPSGQRERYYLLNEDQAFYLLTLSRNTPRVVKLKAALVRAFGEARRKAELHTEYLPGYHELHDAMHRLADGSENERFAHMNLNRLINSVAGVEAGQRAGATFPKLAMLVTAQHLAAQALEGAADHHEGYQRAKEAVSALTVKKVAS